MNPEEIIKLAKAEPFKPFDVHLADGRVLPVPHRDFVFITPSRRTVIIANDTDYDIVNTTVIVSLRVREGDARKAG